MARFRGHASSKRLEECGGLTGLACSRGGGIVGTDGSGDVLGRVSDWQEHACVVCENAITLSEEGKKDEMLEKWEKKHRRELSAALGMMAGREMSNWREGVNEGGDQFELRIQNLRKN
ncbi:hypothetical protein GPALN_011191 [Globodera pallida]|nr:hypothetical protein GPALN_011191 [Globodera pallida]